MNVTFRSEALDDLDGIAEYIAAQNPAAAAWVIARIHAVIYSTLNLYPESGRISEGAAREFTVPHLPYVIVYTASRASIDVIGVFHTARDPKTKHGRNG